MSSISESTQNVLDYLSSFEMFKAPKPTTQEHTVSVGWEPNNHGYPYRATCSCGWASRPYAARHTAEDLASDHAA